MNIHAALHEACANIGQSALSNEAKLEAQLLLEHALKVNHAWLIAHAEDTINQPAYQQFSALVQRRIAGEPIAYILGEREFYGLNLKVTPDTLIPRADTETLVEAALEKVPQTGNEKLIDNFEVTKFYQILDLGTGSGAIALAIAKNRPLAQITAIDASKAALAVAIENAQTLKISNIHFLESDWFAELDDAKFDVIVSNPPYIEKNDLHLSKGDLRYEPIGALASGQDGLDDIRKIVTNAKEHLNQNGWLMLEHGYNQASAVAELFKLAEFKSVHHVKDLAGIDRVTIGQY
ncbi:MAG TPA: peptide chain release factor N(5)-glutamine methyltransferase [Methylophilaceae bacterium]|nr:peptide chain release factor N(5)-glutamine methyltransferase [Methylophilaceae bacterium]